MSLALDWTKRCEDEDDKKATEQAIRSAAGVLNILKEILETKLNALERPSLKDYDSPGWEGRLADRNGSARTLTDIINLVTL